MKQLRINKADYIRGDRILKSYEELIFDLNLVDKLLGVAYENTKLEFYFAGGSACILAGYLDRATRDFDFVDIGYSSKLSKVLKLLEPYDLLTTYFAAIPKNYKDRVKKIGKFKNISVYIFSKEDIIASKIDRLSEKDIDDINKLLAIGIDNDLLKICIEEAYLNIVYEDRKKRYKENCEQFYKKFKSNLKGLE